VFQIDEKNLVVLISIVAATFGILGFFLIAMVNINIRANAKRQMELVKNAFETQERERARIARDLHDSIGQQISAIRLHLGLLSECESKDELVESIKDKQQMLSRATEELRMITRNLMPVAITEYGIGVTLKELVTSLLKANDISLTVSNSNENKRYKPDFEINLFRILQEMINNTIKYAHATNIYIELQHSPERLAVVYSDNGLGFDPEKVKHGLGLRNIEARVNFYRGEYDVESKHAEGTKFFLEFDRSEIQQQET
jgi:signal transduction histidine kinase